MVYRVLARCRDASPAHDAAVLRDYFNLDTQLTSLAAEWAAQCSRFRDVSPHFPGVLIRREPIVWHGSNWQGAWPFAGLVPV